MTSAPCHHQPTPGSRGPWRLVAVRAWLAWLLALTAVWGGSLVAPPPALADDPALNWHTLETSHFIIHYHDRLGDLPERVARFCEEAHFQLTPLLDWVPAEKTHVVLDDRVDTANGSALVVPRNTIRLFMTGPEARGSLGDFDDWLRVLIIHEYTHILHIDTIGGLPAIINEILGKRASPNQVVPRWFTEGAATYQESARTGAGRVRSSLFHMYLRAAWLGGTFFDLGELSATPYQWPRGTAAYLYGSHFLSFVAETRGEAFFRDFNHKYGARFIPYSMNNTAREVVGDDLVTLYQQWQQHLADTYGRQAEALRHEGLTPVQLITERGQEASSPVARPGHRQVTFYMSNGHEQSGIFAHDLDTGEVTRLFDTYGSGGQHSWDPTGRYVVFHATRYHRNTYVYNELVLRDTATGQEVALTRAQRAREPAFSPDGRQVVFVENDAGRTHLVLMEPTTGQRRVLHASLGQGQFDTPAFSPDGRFVAVSYWPDARGRDLYVFDMVTERLVRLTADRAMDMEPRFSPDGRWLTFSSDRTGVYDIYAMEVSGLAEGVERLSQRLPDRVLQLDGLPVARVSRVLGGLFTPQVVADGKRQWLYVASYDVDGFDVARMPFDPATFLGPAPASTLVRPRVAPPQLAEPIITSPTTTYNPFPLLLPRTVSPLLAFNNGGRDSYGVELSGFDPVGHHFWSMVGEYLNDTESVFVVGNYAYNRLPVALGLGLQYSTYDRDRALVRNSQFVVFKEQAFDAQATVGVPILGPKAFHRLTLGYNLRFTDFFGDVPELAPEPADIVPQEPSQGNFSSAFISYFVGDTDRFSQSVTTERGYNLNLTLRFRDPVLGSDVRSMRATYATSFFLPAPWWELHAFVLRLQGGLERTDFRGPDRFALGGLPPQELITAIINETPLGGTFLRGFKPGTARGEQFQLASAEYRFPILNLSHGFETLPFNFGRLSGAVYSDYGSAFNGPLEDARFFLGAGGEVLLETTLGYVLPAFFRMGYAHGFGSKGIDEVYFFLGGSY